MYFLSLDQRPHGSLLLNQLSRAVDYKILDRRIDVGRHHEPNAL